MVVLLGLLEGCYNHAEVATPEQVPAPKPGGVHYVSDNLDSVLRDWNCLGAEARKRLLIERVFSSKSLRRTLFGELRAEPRLSPRNHVTTLSESEECRLQLHVRNDADQACWLDQKAARETCRVLELHEVPRFGLGEYEIPEEAFPVISLTESECAERIARLSRLRAGEVSKIVESKITGRTGTQLEIGLAWSATVPCDSVRFCDETVEFCRARQKNLYFGGILFVGRDVKAPSRMEAKAGQVSVEVHFPQECLTEEAAQGSLLLVLEILEDGSVLNKGSGTSLRCASANQDGTTEVLVRLKSGVRKNSVALWLVFVKQDGDVVSTQVKR